jgi:peptidoglycan/xylan/chitin deacetylase (PgdA/CDA1 family)
MQSGRRITAKIIGTLHSHRAPAVGFVNEGKLDRAGETGARIGLLQQWVDAGLVLGNHTYSHRDFNTATVEQFEDEIVKGEPVTRRLMASREPYPRFFRHPQTHTGDTAAKKEAIERFLASKGYTVAPHAIDTSDFIFNVGYTRALRAGDRRTATRLRDAYLEFAVAATAFAERITSQIFSRDIPQTMLLHANDIGADTLEDLLSRLEARGYEFITLETAMADAAYQTRDTVVTTFGPSWLWRWTKSKSLTISFAEDPDPPEWVMSLYRRGLEGRGRN